ncbi:MAG: hypothetical protein M1821_005567 [Bathelium mastoideum]|nr:MAG: hypothetical protein M1821_005567 [Bathelium mastoideum]KAI9685589.1 MAG: hypothetical protein M1822_004447 [Bathelium mastoideum]
MHERPSYGGTCYSDFTSRQWLTVTEYNEKSMIGTKTLLESTSGQVYAHVIDGLVPQRALQTSSPISAQATLTTGPMNPILTAEPTFASASTPTPNDPSVHLSSTATKTIAIGTSIAGVIVIGVVIFFLLQRYGPARRLRSRRQIEVEKDAVAEQIYEKGTESTHHDPVDRTKAELVGSQVVHQIYHELEDTMDWPRSKESGGLRTPSGHPSKEETI